MKKLALPLLLLTSLATAGNFAEEKYDLSIRRKVGDVQTRQIVMKLQEDGAPFEYTLSERSKLAKVGEDGSLEFETVVTYLKMVAGGETIDLAGEAEIEPETSKEKVAKNGKFLSADNIEGDDTVFRVHHLLDFIRPDSVVGIGTEWTHEFDTEKREGAVKGSIKFKVESKQKVGAFECLKISFKSAESEGADPGSAEGATFIRISDGAVIKSSAKIKNFPYESPIEAEISQELVP